MLKRQGRMTLSAIQKNLGNKSRPRRGMALLSLMLILMMVMAILLLGVINSAGGASGSGGLLTNTESSLMSTRTRGRSLSALNLAESGIELSLQWLREQSAPPADSSAFAPTGMWEGVASGGYTVFTNVGGVPGTLKIRLYPYSSNSGPGLKQYMVESIGTVNGITQIMRGVATQNTFAKYAFFTENANSATWWVGGTTRFNGPVHINDSNKAPINIMWKSGGSSSNQLFTYSGSDAFTTSASSINWNKNGVSNPANPSSATDWKGVAAGGAGTVRTGVASVEMPAASTKQYTAALGPTTLAPATNDPPGVTVPTSGSTTNGGVFVHGDVDSMVLGAEKGANPKYNTGQKITIVQTDQANNQQIKTVVHLDMYAGTTKVEVTKVAIGNSFPSTPDTTTTYSGVTNGVVYSDGNIGNQGDKNNPKTGGLSGVMADSYTTGMPSNKSGNAVRANKMNIVTDASKNINIDGSIQYQSGVSTMGNNTPILGIVSKTIQIIDTDINGNPLGNVVVHGTVMAYDTFDVTNPTTRAPSNFNLTGGYIASNSGQFGTFNPVDGSVQTGYGKTLNYDQRMASTPPPFFPSTANQYAVQSLQRANSTLQ